MTDHTLPVDGPVTVRARTRSSDLVLTAADVGVAEVRLSPRRAGADAQAVAGATRVELVGDTLRIEVPSTRTHLFSSSHALRIEVTVPLGSALVAEAGSGDVRTSGALARVELRCGSGDVQVDEAGEVDVTAGSGDITLGTIGAGQVVTGSGDIRVGSSSGLVTARSGSGDVTVDLAMSVEAASGSGDVSVSELDGSASLRTASGTVVVRRAGRGELTAKTASGDVVVGVPHGTAALLDCGSVSGRVRSELEPSGAPGSDEGTVTLRLRTVSGDIVVRRG